MRYFTFCIGRCLEKKRSFAKVVFSLLPSFLVTLTELSLLNGEEEENREDWNHFIFTTDSPYMYYE